MDRAEEDIIIGTLWMLTITGDSDNLSPSVELNRFFWSQPKTTRDKILAGLDQALRIHKKKSDEYVGPADLPDLPTEKSPPIVVDLFAK